jgi:hypothetical protein
MYRLLAIAGENRERRNRVWSWDITKLQGPTRGTYYELQASSVTPMI